MTDSFGKVKPEVKLPRQWLGRAEALWPYCKATLGSQGAVRRFSQRPLIAVPKTNVINKVLESRGLSCG